MFGRNELTRPGAAGAGHELSQAARAGASGAREEVSAVLTGRSETAVTLQGGQRAKRRSYVWP